MPAPLLILCASLCFATMGLCIKLASAQYATAEIVFRAASHRRFCEFTTFIRRKEQEPALDRR